MAVHAFTPGFESYILLVATSIICLVGLYLLVSQWGHGRPCRFFSFWCKEAFRDGGRVFFSNSDSRCPPLSPNLETE